MRPRSSYQSTRFLVYILCERSQAAILGPPSPYNSQWESFCFLCFSPTPSENLGEGTAYRLELRDLNKIPTCTPNVVPSSVLQTLLYPANKPHMLKPPASFGLHFSLWHQIFSTVFQLRSTPPPLIQFYLFPADGKKLDSHGLVLRILFFLS